MGRSIWSYSLGILIILICSCHAIVLDSLYWNISNTKFTPGQGLVLYPQIGDKMDIVCPRARVGGVGGTGEYHRVYLVTRSQLERCSIDKSDTPLLNCDKPNRDVKFTFKFQEFSPNLWGLEFLRGRDYYITSTSTGSLHGLDNTNGGVCRAKSMKLVLRVGQSPSDPPSTPQESPTRYPPKKPKSGSQGPSTKNHDAASNKNGPTDGAAEMTETKGGDSPDAVGSDTGVFMGVVWGGVIIITVIVVVLLVLLWRHQRRHCIPEGQQSASMSLNTLAMPKRGSGGSSDHDSDPSDIVFPLRPSESMFCRHYERVSGDYGPPVYIVQEIPPQSPTNIYYKV
ncbi:ephrin-B2a-like isoform X1 [Osmerus eperlanus]|uniref:ephrin-B2a-like isoform X1 n=1 Tax=Osmerus eperlanus TaxID=29151 RepID=UPI002E135377